MTETPREYKKRVDEKRIRNGKNVDKLIKEIDKYELLDQNYKTVTKQQILDNFSKNQKAEKESEQYLTISTELEQIEEKYKALEEMKRELVSKKANKAVIEGEIAKVKMDGVDKTTLNMQRAELNEKNNKYNAIKLEIAGIEKEITNREQEIQEIESTYGVKLDNRIMKEDLENKKESSSSVEEVKDQLGTLKPGTGTLRPGTLKFYHKQTVGDLRIKDKIVGEIWRLLDEGTGIDDELKNRIKDDVSKKFFEYYDEQHSDLRMKSAKFVKNKIRITSKRLKEFKDMYGPKKEDMLNKIERSEKIYGEEIGKTGLLMSLNKMGKNIRKLVDVERCGTISKPIFKLKNDKGDYGIVRGDLNCGDRYKEIGEIKEVGGKPCFRVTLEGGWDCVIWGTDVLGNGYEIIGDIQEIGGKPCFKAKLKNGRNCVIWGTDKLEDGWNIVGDIQEIGGKPAFEAVDKKGKSTVYRGMDDLCKDTYDNYGNSKHHDVIGKIQNIGGKPCFVAGDRRYTSYRSSYVYWGKDRCGGEHKKILGDIENIGDKPCFQVNDDFMYDSVYWGTEKCGSDYNDISAIIEIGGEPCFKGKKGTLYTTWYIVWGDYESKGYVYVGDIKGVRGKPVCTVQGGGYDRMHTVTINKKK